MIELKLLHQNTIGSRFRQNLAIQPKLKIGQPGDKYEREADAVAQRVMKMGESETMQMQPVEGEEEVMQPKLRMQPIEEEEEPIRMKCAKCDEMEMLQPKSEEGNVAAPSIEQQINSTKGNGRHLSTKSNRIMSNAFGTDFSEVQIHTGQKASQLNQRLGARAFTYGNNIYFNSGEYRPDSSTGKSLLAHELTHVVQQTSPVNTNMISRTPDPSDPFDLPAAESNELKRLTGNRIDRSASYYNDALLEVKIKVGRMLKAQKAAADAIFELAFGLLMPGLGKLVGRGLANVANNLPVNASTTSYRAAIALLDADRTKDVFVKATDIGHKISKIELNNKLESITGDAEYETFFTALEKSAAVGFDRIDSELANKTDKELGILYMSYDPAATTSSDYVKVIEDLVVKFTEQVKPIGKKTGGAYGPMKARWIEGSRWKALALTGEGRYFNVGGGPTFITWISPEMKNSAIEATKAVNWGRVDTVHYSKVEGSGSTTTASMRAMLDSYLPSSVNDKVIEVSSGTTDVPDRYECPSCHGERRGNDSPEFPDFRIPENETPLWNLEPNPVSESDRRLIIEWINSTASQ